MKNVSSKQRQTRFTWDDKLENVVKCVQHFNAAMEFSNSDSIFDKVKINGSVTCHF